ncbi:STT3 domain-containing protein [Methanobacterium aggregans]|uniref:STT3 domain-containing protein n=1 Tax=Methanobacterium aggregans TaxID=1615586 RepID=UPI001AE19AB3|nr:STT3 domain-containing protein [Methanobacterium aggregans]MBP2044845.1 dolichyl-diphosphooligosaccharide--protein glycosyltransferase [Methanobacterium aggregans]
MSKKQILITLIIILIIFMVGFVLRVESTNLPGVPLDEKAYYQDQNGLPYMYEMDSYYNYRLTKNYLEHGHTGDTFINGTEWDFHSYAPSGVPMDYPPLIVYLTAFVYKFINLFASVPLLVVCFWIPAFVGPLAGIMTYFFVRRYTNNYGAAAAGILAVTAPLYLVRTVPGWFDTDMFNVFFPILVTWLFVEAVTAQKFKNQIILSLSAAFAMVLFALAWNGWQYQFYLLVIFTSIYILWRKIRGGNVKNCAYIISIYFVSTLLLVGIFTGFLNVINLFEEPQTLLKMLSSHGVWYPWPNVYVSVSELQKPSIWDVMSGVGPAFFGGILGILWILRVMINPKLKKRFLNRMTWFFYLMLIAWTLIGFVSFEEGSRFLILLISPLVISSGILIGLVINYLSLLKENHVLNIFQREGVIKIFKVVIILLVTVPAVFSVYESTCALQTGANDDLWDSALWINNNTQNNTIVIVEWGYGHLFSAIANRSVSFDGRTAYIETLSIRQFDGAYKFGSESPSSSREYWINHAFSTDNQTLSLGIFRMLTTSGDMGYITLDQYTKNTTQSVMILNSILGVDNETAKEILLTKYGLNEEQAENVLQYTHPSDSRPFVLVTSINTLGRGKAIFKFGEWDFNDVKEGNYTYSVGTFVINGTILNSTNKVVMNMKTRDITWNGSYPYSFILIKNGTMKEQRINNNSNFSVAVLMDVNKTVVIDKSLENSMFMKLWVENSNSTMFKPIYRKGTVTVWQYV